MLVLTRKTGQKLIISNNITVSILDVKGESVKIGIEAPKDVSVYREEIYLEISRANQQSVQSNQLDSVKGLTHRFIQQQSPPPDSFPG